MFKKLIEWLLRDNSKPKETKSFVLYSDNGYGYCKGTFAVDLLIYAKYLYREKGRAGPDRLKWWINELDTVVNTMTARNNLIFNKEQAYSFIRDINQ